MTAVHPWRARLERWFRPLAQRSPLSPNALTLLAFLLNLAAAALFASARFRPILFMVAIPVITIGGLLDAFDGIVAREQNKASRFGDFLDHLLDRASDLALLAGWLIGARVRLELAIPLLILVALNGYAGTQIEATFGSRSYEGVGRGEFVLALVAIPILTYVIIAAGADSFRIAMLSLAEALAVLLALGALAGIAQRIRLARSLGRD
jgi:CDP-diacylglycerol--glycerol-3-phosphate 3-phosphatidyltransferase/archaetidylinositol phosphate synthase